MARAPVIFTVKGEPASKSNQRRLVMTGDKPRMIKSKKAIDYLDAFAMQCPSLGDEMFEGEVHVVMRMTYASWRPDLDGGMTLILDAMQGKIYKNDRQVASLIVTKEKPDKANPHVIIEVRSFDRA